MAKRKRESICLHGYFLEKQHNDEEDGSDESDGSDDDEWLDFDDINAMSEHSSYFKSQQIQRETALFKDYDSGKTYNVNGCFPMKQPWWAAKLTVTKPRGNGVFCYLRGFPAYHVRTDDRVVKEGVVSLLLSACEVNDDHKHDFLQAVESWEENYRLTLQELPDLLKKFSEFSDENKSKASQIEGLLMKGQGKMVYQCLENDDVYTYLPQLFPRKFQSLATKLKPEKLLKLQEIIQDEPWALAFSNVLRNKHNMYGLEAKAHAFEESGLSARLTPVQRDAVHIYDVMKRLCANYGHTFIYGKSLHQNRAFGEYQVNFWREALEFLEKNGVIVTEKDEGKENFDYAKVYLWRLWKAERSIAEAFADMFRRQQENPWELDIDFSSPDFEDLLSDNDQKKAAELIATKSVVCLSGKGGCGKTHVVSKVFKYAEKHLKLEREREYQEEMFNQSDVDDLTLARDADAFERTYLDKGDGTLDDLKDLEDLNEMSITSQIVLSQVATQATQGGSRYVTDLSMETYMEDPTQAAERKDTSKLEEAPLVLLTAPTGKAANLLGRRSQLSSNTLHQVIFNYRAWKRAGRNGKEQAWKYSQVEALVVDECSLVSVSTFSTLIDMLIHDAKLKKIVLLGDINQLPSIEPGNFLTDVYSSLGAVGCSHMLNTNHRSESQLIIDNASRISQQQLPVIDARRHFEKYKIKVEPLPGAEAADDGDFGIEQDEIVAALLKENPALKSHATSQFVAFRRKDCDKINEKCCKHYCNHVTLNEKGRRNFQVGDKVCCTKNTLTVDHITKTPVRLCNGEIFFITEDAEVEEGGSKKGKKKSRYLTLDDKENPPVKIAYDVLRHKCKLKHSWARTIHTYQGSESDTVVYVVGSGRGQTWQHVYTAVTRGKKHVILLTREQDIAEAICRLPGTRNTMLKTRMRDALSALPGAALSFAAFHGASSLFNGQTKFSAGSKPESFGQYSCVYSSTPDILPTRLKPVFSKSMNCFSPVKPVSAEKGIKPSSDSGGTPDPSSVGVDSQARSESAEGSQNFSDWGDSMVEMVENAILESSEEQSACDACQAKSSQSESSAVPCDSGKGARLHNGAHRHVCTCESPICTCSGDSPRAPNIRRSGPFENEFVKEPKPSCSYSINQGASSPESEGCGTCWREHDPFSTPTNKFQSPDFTSPKRPSSSVGLGPASKCRRALPLDVVTSSDVSPVRQRLDASLKLTSADKPE